MGKTLRKMGLLLLIFSALMGGCGTQQKNGTEQKIEGDVVNIYCWNTEFKGIYEA